MDGGVNRESRPGGRCRCGGWGRSEALCPAPRGIQAQDERGRGGRAAVSVRAPGEGAGAFVFLGGARRACKPGSVRRTDRRDDHSSGPAVACGPRAANPGLWGRATLRAISVARSFPREAPIRHCSRWGLPCRSGCPSRGGLLPHRFTLSRGGPRVVWFSVALSLGLPRPGVTRHRALWSPDFPRTLPAPCGAAVRGHPALRARVGVTPGGRGRQPESGGQGPGRGRRRLRRRGRAPRGGSAGGRPQGAGRAAGLGRSRWR